MRDALAWSKYTNEALYRFGDQAEVMFASHSWPRWGKDRIQEAMRGERQRLSVRRPKPLAERLTTNRLDLATEPFKAVQEQCDRRNGGE